MKKLNLVFNKKNLKYNIEKFGTNNNILYITGLSGSGKTTIAKKLVQEYKAELFELDNLGGHFGEYKNEQTLIYLLTEDFLNKNLELRKIIKSDNYVTLKINNFDEYVKWTNKYVEFLEKYAYFNEGLYIFEGTQLFKCINPKHYINKPLIIVGTSSISSLYRRLKRHYKIDKIKNKPNFFKKHIWKLLNDSKRLHFKDLFHINKFLKQYSKYK